MYVYVYIYIYIYIYIHIYIYIYIYDNWPYGAAQKEGRAGPDRSARVYIR